MIFAVVLDNGDDVAYGRFVDFADWLHSGIVRSLLATINTVGRNWFGFMAYLSTLFTLPSFEIDNGCFGGDNRKFDAVNLLLDTLGESVGAIESNGLARSLCHASRSQRFFGLNVDWAGISNSSAESSSWLDVSCQCIDFGVIFNLVLVIGLKNKSP